jgi:hypothetical protein
MLELTEAVQQLLDRTTAQVRQESSRQVTSVLRYTNREDGPPWEITWATRSKDQNQ